MASRCIWLERMAWSCCSRWKAIPARLAVYAGSPVSRFYNHVACEAVRSALHSLDHRARILEVGAGTGSTTEALLAAIPAECRIRIQ